MNDFQLTPSDYFPPVEDADEDGLLAMGGCLDPEWLIDAYSHAIFPWPIAPEYPMTWFSPDPRGVIPLEQFYIARRLRRKLRARPFRITVDRAFEDVMWACSGGPGRDDGTWITQPIVDAYCQLNRLSFAHSVECWSGDGRLVGGVYGVAIGGLFAAESMFHRETDASKVALAYLVEHLRRCGFRLLDIQMITPHTQRLGAIEIPRDEYMQQLAAALPADTQFTAALDDIRF